MSLMTEPEQMRDFSRRFHAHADVIEDESKKAYAASQNISGAAWTGLADVASSGSVAELVKAFNNIRDMMQWVSDNLARSADEYEHTEQGGAQALST